VTVPLQFKITDCPVTGLPALSLTVAVMVSEEMLSAYVIHGDGTVIVRAEGEEDGLLLL